MLLKIRVPLKGFTRIYWGCVGTVEKKLETRGLHKCRNKKKVGINPDAKIYPASRAWVGDCWLPLDPRSS